MSLFQTQFPRIAVPASRRTRVVAGAAPTIGEIEAIRARAEAVRSRAIADGTRRALAAVAGLAGRRAH